MSSNPWIKLAKSLALSRSETEVVRRFEADPEGRSFLPLADILKANQYPDEAMELLLSGVERHPTFSVARVVLARELFHRGSIVEAKAYLDKSPDPLKDNVLAQKLQFKMAVLLGRSDDARKTLQHLEAYRMLDGETARLADLWEKEGVDSLKAKLLEEFRERNVEVVLPQMLSPAELPATLPIASVDMAAAVPDVALLPLSQDFQVVPLGEIFLGADQAASEPASGIELDSSTLADIYAGQGHFQKALTIYRRLLRLQPQSQTLRHKIAELARLDRDQRDRDLSVDPAVVDSMENVEIIDRQLKFLNALLADLA